MSQGVLQEMGRYEYGDYEEEEGNRQPSSQDPVALNRNEDDCGDDRCGRCEDGEEQPPGLQVNESFLTRNSSRSALVRSSRMDRRTWLASAKRSFAKATGSRTVDWTISSRAVPITFLTSPRPSKL